MRSIRKFKQTKNTVICIQEILVCAHNGYTNQSELSLLPRVNALIPSTQYVLQGCFTTKDIYHVAYEQIDIQKLYNPYI